MAFAYKFQSLDVNGSSLTFLDLGIGEAVLLGHSYLWDAEMWRPQIEILARHHRVIVPNLWGHGGSGPLPAGTRDLRDLATHHLALMDHLGIKRFAIAGLSVGGMRGAELALMAPQRVSALALLDTYLGPEPEATRQKYFAMMEAIASAKRIPEPLLDAIVPLYFAPDVQSRQPALPAAFRLRLQNWDADRLQDSVLPIGRMVFARRDARADLRNLRMPRIVLTGAEDMPRPVHEGQQMATILDCSFVEIPGAGHIATLESPQQVTDHLVGFLVGAHGGDAPKQHAAL